MWATGDETSANFPPCYASSLLHAGNNRESSLEHNPPLPVKQADFLALNLQPFADRLLQSVDGVPGTDLQLEVAADRRTHGDTPLTVVHHAGFVRPVVRRAVVLARLASTTTSRRRCSSCGRRSVLYTRIHSVSFVESVVRRDPCWSVCV